MAPHTERKTPGIRPRLAALAMLAVVGAALLSGCAGLGDSEDNRAPTARLDADKDTAWAGEEITFDAQASDDPDGNVTQWRFDFGDGTRMTVTDEDEARVKHAYVQGGEYVVTLTVVDDGTQDGLQERSDETALRIAVDDRFPVAAQVVRAEPLNTTAGSRMALPFGVRDGADRAVANLTLRNALLVGSSEVRLRLLDPSGDLLDEQAVTLDSSEPKDVEFSALLDEAGNHTLEVVAESGSAQATGELQVLYSDAPDPDKVEDAADT